MYEYRAGGLLDALVIVQLQYMHVQSITCCVQLFYGKWCARDRSLYKEAEEHWETAGVMTDD